MSDHPALRAALHPVPRPPLNTAEPPPLVHGMVAVERAVEFDLYGHHDFSNAPQSWVVRLAGSENSMTHAWVALPECADPEAPSPDDVWGFAALGLPLREDLDTGIIEVAVRAEQRGRGLGTALLERALDALRAQGRRTALAYAYAPTPPDGTELLMAATGAGGVDASAHHVGWLRRGGWTLEQCERPSTLTLDPAALDHADRLGAAARERAFGYELHSWVGPTPARFADGVALAMTRMSTDVPAGDLDPDEQVWDAERLAAAEDRQIRAGNHHVSTLAVHALSGAAAAFTTISWPDHNPAGCWQEETIVLTEHRGHRLGMLVKTTNLRRLVEANPDARRVHTWNADENEWMLAINDELGFRPHGMEGAWRLHL